MLLLFFLIISNVVGGLLIGNALLTKLDPWRYFDRPGDRAIIATWIGVLILANFYLILSFFGPLSPPITIPASLLLLGLSLLSRRARRGLGFLAWRSTVGTIVGIIALTLGVAAYCSQVIVWYDSGLYHVQVIKWLSEFGLVPGLALIHSRFGVVSSWFALPAVFNKGILKGRISSLPGALCLLLLLSHALVAFGRIAGKRGRIEDLFIAAACLLVVPMVLVWGVPNSPSPDFPVIVLTVVVAWTMLIISGWRKDSKGPEPTLDITVIPLILAIGAASIKLSALPLLIVTSCYCLIKAGRSIKRAAAIIGMIVLGLLPVASAGILASGCAFYPVSYLCTDLPWSLGTAAAQTESRVIQGWARWGGAPPEHATPWGWILPWFHNERVFFVLILFSLLLIVLLLLPRINNLLRQYAYIMMIGIIGTAFSFYAAPTWRFGLGYVVVLLALAATIHAVSSSAALPRGGNGIKGLNNFGLMGAAVAMVLALHVHVIQRPSYRLLDEAAVKGLVRLRQRRKRKMPKPDEGVVKRLLVSTMAHPHFNLLLPPKVWNLSYGWDEEEGRVEVSRNIITKAHTADVDYYRANGSNTCWDSPLPCTPYKLKNIRLRMPMQGLAGGFKKNYPGSYGLPLTHF